MNKQKTINQPLKADGVDIRDKNMMSLNRY